MAVLPQKRPVVAHDSDQLSGSRQITLTYRQVVLLWLATAVAMFLVFCGGIFTGRKQGVDIALEERGVPIVRLPIDSQLPSASIQDGPRVEPKVDARSQEFDFSQSRVLTADGREEDGPPVGFAARPAGTVNPAGSSDPSPRYDSASLSQQTAIQKRVSDTTPLQAKPTESGSRVVAPPLEKARRGKFTVQVAAPQDRKTALTVLAKLKRAGIASQVHGVKLGKTTYYRVLTMPVEDRKSAESLRQRVAGLKAAADVPFVRTSPPN